MFFTTTVHVLSIRSSFGFDVLDVGFATHPFAIHRFAIRVPTTSWTTSQARTHFEPAELAASPLVFDEEIWGANGLGVSSWQFFFFGSGCGSEIYEIAVVGWSGRSPGSVGS